MNSVTLVCAALDRLRVPQTHPYCLHMLKAHSLWLKAASFRNITKYIKLSKTTQKPALLYLGPNQVGGDKTYIASK